MLLHKPGKYLPQKLPLQQASWNTRLLEKKQAMET
jgi:hypothetical protein